MRSHVKHFITPLDWQPLGLQPARLLCPWGFSQQEYWSGLTCPLPGIFLTRDGTQVSCMQGDSLLSDLPAPKKWVLTIQKMPDLSAFVSCNSGFFFQLTYRSHFYPPERCLECKFSKRKKSTQKELISGIAVKILSKIPEAGYLLLIIIFTSERTNGWPVSAMFDTQ